jgi:hypothetical protein
MSIVGRRKLPKMVFTWFTNVEGSPSAVTEVSDVSSFDEVSGDSEAKGNTKLKKHKTSNEKMRISLSPLEKNVQEVLGQ